MLKVATAKEMQWIDRTAIRSHRIAGTLLMEQAGIACFDKINELYPTINVIILCGGGNNGGDGFVIARLLHKQGRDVKVFLAAAVKRLKGDARINYDAAKDRRVDISSFKKFIDLKRISKQTLIVDAMLGTGLSKEVKEPLSDVIRKVNRLSSPVLSIDIPSGISADTGQIMGIAVKADHTVTFGLPKRGHLLYPGADHTGGLYIADIGFPKKLLSSSKIKANLFQNKDAVKLIPKRPRNSHKGTYGHVLIVAGSRGKTGAALMAAKACLGTGAGLVTIGVPETLLDVFQVRVTEEMILPLPDKGDGTLSSDAAADILSFIKKRRTVLAIGPGLSNDNEIAALVKEILAGAKAPVVIDADGLNAIAGRTGILKKCKASIVLTPHAGEMSRLLKQDSEVIEKDRIGTAVSFAKKTGICLVLKGAPAVTATSEGDAFINSSGNPGMATAGSGDVLTGMISALLAQGLRPYKASVLGVYMHGMIGDIVAQEKGEHSLIASDIINAIPYVFRSIKG